MDEPTPSDGDLIPWQVKVDHRWAYPVVMLATEKKRRAGVAVPEDLQERLESWLAMMLVEDYVVAYDATTDDGFSYVPREPGDSDLIRRPA